MLRFWHETLLFVFPPGARFLLSYTPRPQHVYLVFGMTMGKVRDFDTGDTLSTDDYGFWHRHSQMKWHWDPGVESIYEFEYPHWLEVTGQDPAEMEFYNNTGLTIIQDFSIWLFECHERNWKYVRQYLRGLWKFLYEKGAEE